MNTPAKAAACESRLEDRRVARLVPGRGLGQGLLLDQRRRATSSIRPSMDAGPRNRSVRGRPGTQGARPAHAGGHPLLRHPRPPPAPPRGRVRHRHCGKRLPEPLRRGVSDQGQPAAPGGRGGLPLRQGIRLRARGRLQARAARGHVHHRGCARPHRGLQRLQGRQLHRGGHHRHQARPHHHSGGGELTKKST